MAAPVKQTLESMLDLAQNELDQFHLEEARQLLNQALEMWPDSVRALEMSSSLLLDIGEMEAARTCLQRACELQPDAGHTKYLSLAQLLHGADAVRCYSRAVELMTAAADDQQQQQQWWRQQLSSALCALADLHMTDLCDEPDAEQRCREYVERALATDPTNAETHLTHASLQLVLNDQSAANAALKRSTDLWLPEYQAARRGIAAAAAGPLELCPLNYDVRLATARALIECQEWDTAVQVLDGLSEEDDQVVDTWYLLGLVAVERGGDDGTARDRRAEARANLRRAQAIGEQDPEQRDTTIDKHISQLLTELGPEDQEEDQEHHEENGEDEWTDDDDDNSEQQNNMELAVADER